jgi:tetratricopeptide (TPR) repeat protein
MQENPLPAQQSSGQSPARSRGQTLTVILTLVAIIAIGAAIYAWGAKQTAMAQLRTAQAQAAQAEQNFKASKRAIDRIVSDLADSLGNATGIQVQGIAPVLVKVANAVGELATKTENDPELRRIRGAMYVQFSATYLALGDSKLAVNSARNGTEIFRALAAAEPSNDVMQSNIGLSLAKLAEALRASGDNKGALATYQESLDIARTLASKDPGNRQFRTDVVLALWRLASAGDDPREHLTEALKILNNLKLATMLTPDQEQWIRAIENELAQSR